MGIKKKLPEKDLTISKPGLKKGRRKFLRNGLLTIAGAGMTSSSLSKCHADQGDNREKVKFVYRTLGKTGIRLPIVSMGTGSTQSSGLVSAALDKGVKLLATSPYYQNGKNEKMVGSIIKGRHRDSFVVLTSVDLIKWSDTRTGELKPGFDPKIIIKKVDESLKRLNVDHIDILVQAFAATRKSVLSKPIRDAMEAIRKSGKVKYIGIATHRLEHEAIRAAVDSGKIDVVMTSYNFRRKGWKWKQEGKKLDDAIRYAAESGMGIIAMKTMAGVYWDKERTQPINASAALKWVLQNKNIHTIVPDCTSYDQLDQNLGLMADLNFTEAETRSLEPPSKELVSGLYCQQCNKCISQCPASMDIPTIMRSYMYAYGYRNLEHAKDTLSMAGLKSLPCVDCSDCVVNCSMGFNVKKKILDIGRLTDVPEDLIRYT